MDDAHAREVEDVLSFFGTDVHTGLSDFEVSKVQAAASTSCCWVVELVAPAATAVGQRGSHDLFVLPPAVMYTLWQQRAAS